jgi:eukaryotic-like serine/threonine-protein kinase
MQCLDDHQAMDLVRGRCDPRHVAEWDVHLDTCPDCQRLLAAIALASSAAPVASSVPLAPSADSSKLRLPVSEVALIADRYRVLGCLGAGAMGVVYTCRDTRLNREVAVKLVRGTASSDQLVSLRTEALAMAQISHPNVVRVYDAEEIGSDLCIVMEQVEGRTLREFMAGQTTLAQRVDALYDALEGLVAAHSAGVLHGDVKPDNVLVASNGCAKIGDFGLARFARVQGDAVVDGRPERAACAAPALAGTPAYMAPELLRGGIATAASDQFAFAVMAWEVLYGTRPFAGSSLTGLLTATLQGPPPAPAWSDAPSRRMDVAALARALDAEATSRFVSLREFATALFPPANVTFSRSRILRYVSFGAASALVAVGLRSLAMAPGTVAVPIDPCAGAGRSFTTTIAPGVARLAAGPWIAAGGPALASGLVQFAERGAVAREQICRANQPSAAVDGSVRTQCTDASEISLRALVAEIAADSAANRGALAEALSALPDPRLCAELPVSQHNPVAGDTLQAAQALSAQIQVHRAIARLRRQPDAADTERSLVARAEQLGYPPVRIQALLVQADGLRIRGAYADADAAALLAIAAAERTHDDTSVAEAWLLRVTLAGEQRDLARVQLWLPLARAAVERAGNSPPASAKIALQEGLLAMNRGELEVADHALARALSLRSGWVGDAPDLELARIMSARGHVARLQQDYAASEHAHTEALRVDRLLLGDAHADTGRDLHNLAGVARLRGDLGLAMSLYLQALHIRQQALGADHPEVGLTENSMGLIGLEQHDLPAATRHFERALDLLSTAGHEDAVLAHENLMTALHAQGRDGEALAHADAARLIELRQFPLKNQRLAVLLETAALIATGLHEIERARSYRQGAAAAREGVAIFARHSSMQSTAVVAPVVPVLREVDASSSAADAALATPAPQDAAAPVRDRNQTYGSTQSW